eukprot:366245-Chlamydomonas_euryale.AAC.8
MVSAWHHISHQHRQPGEFQQTGTTVHVNPQLHSHKAADSSQKPYAHTPARREGTMASGLRIGTKMQAWDSRTRHSRTRDSSTRHSRTRDSRTSPRVEKSKCFGHP